MLIPEPVPCFAATRSPSRHKSRARVRRTAERVNVPRLRRNPSVPAAYAQLIDPSAPLLRPYQTSLLETVKVSDAPAMVCG